MLGHKWMMTWFLLLTCFYSRCRYVVEAWSSWVGTVAGGESQGPRMADWNGGVEVGRPANVRSRGTRGRDLILGCSKILTSNLGLVKILEENTLQVTKRLGYLDKKCKYIRVLLFFSYNNCRLIIVCE